jgi:hypothetical protein
MKIREFYSIFSSKDESGFLFAVLKKVSLLEEIGSIQLAVWSGWPPGPEPEPGPDPEPGGGTLSGPSPARA